MARYAFGNTLAAFYRTTTACVESTTSGRFDSNFVSSAILLPSSTDAIISQPFIDSSNVTEIWVQWEAYYTGAVASSTIFALTNSSGQDVLIIKTSVGGNLTIQYWNGSSFVTLGSSYTNTTGQLIKYTVHATAGLSGAIDIYKGNSIYISLSGLNAAVDNFAQFRLTGQATSAYISQVLAADYDLRDCKFMQTLADGDGADTDGTGSYTDINETILDESTAIVLPAVSNKKTFTKSSTTVPAGYVISCMTVAARGRVSGGTVTDGKLVVRSGGVDYDSGSKSFNGGYEPRGHYLDNDPATGVPFTGAGYNSAEFGIKAA